MHDAEKPERRQPAFVAAMKAVLWSFLGIRKKSAYERDAAHLTPLHVILAALIGVSIFIAVLVLLVRIAVAA